MTAAQVSALHAKLAQSGYAVRRGAASGAAAAPAAAAAVARGGGPACEPPRASPAAGAVSHVRARPVGTGLAVDLVLWCDRAASAAEVAASAAALRSALLRVDNSLGGGGGTGGGGDGDCDGRLVVAEVLVQVGSQMSLKARCSWSFTVLALSYNGYLIFFGRSLRSRCGAQKKRQAAQEGGDADMAIAKMQLFKKIIWTITTEG